MPNLLLYDICLECSTLNQILLSWQQNKTILKQKSKASSTFQNKKTNCNFRKLLVLVAFAQSPLLLNFLVFNQSLLFFILLSYAWYNISLIIGLNIVLSYNNHLKTTLISLAPQIIFLLYFLSLVQGGSGIVS